MNRRLIALSIMAGVGSCASGVLGVAPSDQVVSGDGPGTSLYSVVDFLHPSAANPALPNTTFDDGTGSIVGKHQLGTDGYLCVLTADHVVTGGSNFVAIGSSGAAGQSFRFVTTAFGGQTGKEDVRIGYVDIGNITAPGAALTLYNNITPLQVINPSQGRAPLQAGNIFTQYGYGDTGSAIIRGGVAGYQDVNSSFVKRFQNNTVASISASAASPYAGGIYTEPLVNWNTVAPANNNGQGTSFGGDSGGPYLTSFPGSMTITRNGSSLTIANTLTDYIGAIHVGGTSVGGVNPTTKLNGQQNWGVPIDQSLYDWQNYWCDQVVPEPASAGLLTTLLCIGILSRRCHKVA